MRAWTRVAKSDAALNLARCRAVLPSVGWRRSEDVETYWCSRQPEGSEAERQELTRQWLNRELGDLAPGEFRSMLEEIAQ